MSESQMSVRSSSGSAPGGGRIITQNPALLDMLREKTLEREEKQINNVTRFYVDSPVYTREDEENIKFVSTDIEEDSLDENYEPESVNQMPSVNDLVSKTVNLQSRQNTNTKQFGDSKYNIDSSRFEDTEKSAVMAHPPRKPTKGPDRTWNALQKGYEKGHGFDSDNRQKSVNFDNNHTEIPSGRGSVSELSKSGARIITPIDNPLRPISKEQTEEMKLLEEEERYQEELKQRIWNGKTEVEKVHIPKLNLDEVVSDDDDEKRRKKGIVADSLESSDRSPEPQSGDNSQDLQQKYAELQHRLERLESEKLAAAQPQNNDQRLQQMFDSQHTNPPSSRRMTSNDLKNLQDPRVRSQYSQEYEYVAEDQFVAPPSDSRVNEPPVAKPPVYRGTMPLNFASEYEVDESATRPQQYDSPEQQQYQQQPQEVIQQYAQQPQELIQQYPQQPQEVIQQYPQQPQEVIQQYPQQQPHPPQQQFQQQTQQDNEHSARHSHLDDMQYYYAENPDYNLPMAPGQQYSQGAEPYNDQGENHGQGYGHVPMSEQPHLEGYRMIARQKDSKDYIDMNKRALRGDHGSAKSYGKMFHRKKDYDTGPPPLPVQHAMNKGKPVKPVSVPSGQSRVSTSTLQSTPANTRLPTTVEEESENLEEMSAEERWAKRAQSLAGERHRKASKQGKQRSQVSGGLRKFSSASRLEGVKSQKQSNTPQGGQSLQSSAVQRPPRASNPMSPSKHTLHANPVKSDTYTVTHPVSTHSVSGENGQKIGFDINMKVVSPSAGGVNGEPPLQLQSVSSSASTIRHGPPEYPGLRGMSMEQPRVEGRLVEQPAGGVNNNNLQQYGYQHSPQQGNQHYHYATQQPTQPPPHRGAYSNVIPNRVDQQQSVHLAHGDNGSMYAQAPVQPTGAVPPQMFTDNTIQSGSQPSKGGFTKYQPVKAFDQYQPSYEHYNEPYGLQDSYSGVTSPVSGYDKSSPTPGNMSPYRVVPPINSAEKQGRKFTQYGPPAKSKQTSNSPRHYGESNSPRPYRETELYGEQEGSGGSYMEAFEKNKQKRDSNNYKAYTLRDYRNMKKEVRLGGLGPDIDSETLKEKRDKLQRKLNYAKSINDRNREEYEVARTRPKANNTFTRDDDDSEQDMIDKRRLALEYAKSVPKPKVKAHEEDDLSQGPNSAMLQRKHRYVPGGHTNSMKTMTTYRAYPSRGATQNSSRGTNDGGHYSPAVRKVSANTERDNEMIDLEALQQRHEQERQKVALIKQNMQVS